MGQFTFSGGGGGGGGGVTSVFGRAGVVVAVNGDYTASNITNVPAGNIGAVTVQAAVNELDTEKVAKAGDTMTGNLIVNKSGAAVPAAFGADEIRVVGSAGADALIWSDSFAGPPVFGGRRAQGVPGAPTAVQSGNTLAAMRGYGYGATLYSASHRGSFTILAAENWTDSAQGTRLVLATTPNGGAGQSARWNVENDGSLIYVGGSLTGISTINALGYWHTNVEIIDANRIFRPRSYTIGTLPAVPATGIVHCSDLGGGAGLLSSDGTGWVREDNTGTTTIATDAGHTFTWDRLVDAPVTRGNAALTALRTATLSTTGCANGDRASFVRLGGGAFNWAIAGGTTFNLTGADQFCTFEFDGTTWNIIDGGRISVAAGSGVDVQDEGIAVIMATALNFVGSGVTATNGGGGVATITIPSGLTVGQYFGLRSASNF